MPSRVLVLAVLAVGAIVAAIALTPVMANTPILNKTVMITVKVVMDNGLKGLMKSLINKTLQSKLLKLAKEDPKVKELISEGYEIVKVIPKIRCSASLSNGVLKTTSAKVVGAIVVLKKGNNYEYVIINLSGNS